MFIEVPVEYHKEGSKLDNPLYEELGISLNEDEEDLESRFTLINTDYIISSYPYWKDSSKTVIEIPDTNLLSSMSYREIKNLIHNT